MSKRSTSLAQLFSAHFIYILPTLYTESKTTLSGRWAIILSMTLFAVPYNVRILSWRYFSPTIILCEWVCGCCLTPHQQYFSHIMTRTSCIWWNDDNVSFVLANISHSASSLKQQSAGRHVVPTCTRTHLDSEPTSVCFYSLMLVHAYWRSSKYQFYSFLFGAA